MNYQLVATDRLGVEHTFDLDCIKIIPTDLNLFIQLSAEVMDSDFQIICGQIHDHMDRPGRTILIARAGDVQITALARGDDHGDG